MADKYLNYDLVVRKGIPLIDIFILIRGFFIGKISYLRNKECL